MITAVDAHACGELTRHHRRRPDVPGKTMFEKKNYPEHADDLRKRMLREPRGYPAANCTPFFPTRPTPTVIIRIDRVPPMSGNQHDLRRTVLIETE
jgi:proline racemase